MTIRPGQPSRKSTSAGVAKSSAEGMDVVMMNDFEQRHLNTKSRSHSPFGHIGSPTTPLNFEQLFLQGQIPLSSELSQHEQAMLQAQLLNGIRSSGMAPKPKPPQPSLAMVDQFRHAYNRSEQEQAFNRESHEQAEWNARVFSAQQQQHAHAHSSDASTEPTPIALLQQKFAQIERHKEKQHKSAASQPPQHVQVYPSQWPMSVPNSMPPVSSAAAAYTDSRHYVPTSAAGFYSFQPAHNGAHQQQQQHASASQVMGAPHSMSEVPDQFYGAKQEISWRPTQEARPQWNAPSNIDVPSTAPPLMYMGQFQAPKVVEYQQGALQHRVPEFAVPQSQASFGSFQLNAPASDMGLLGSVVVSSRCDMTGHSMDMKSVNDHYNNNNNSSRSRSEDSEMSLDNFSGRAGHVAQPQVPSLATASQIQFSSNSFHMLPQSSKSAFSTFTRPSSNLNPAATTTTTTTTTTEAVTKSLLFNDTYRRSQEVPDLHDDVDTELHL